MSLLSVRELWPACSDSQVGSLVPLSTNFLQVQLIRLTVACFGGCHTD